MTVDSSIKGSRHWLWIALVLSTVAAVTLVADRRLQLTEVERAFVGTWTGSYSSAPSRPTTVYFRVDGTGDMGCWSVHDGHLLVHRRADTPWIERCWQRLVGIEPDGYPMRIVSVSNDRIVLEGSEFLELRRKADR